MNKAEFLEFLNHGMALARQTADYGTPVFPRFGGGLEFVAFDPDQTKLRFFVEGRFFTIRAVDVQEVMPGE